MKASRETNATLSRLARGKQLAACRAAFRVAEKAGTTDAWSHAILINAYATCGDSLGALAALEAMRASGHRPCVMSYTAALKAPCARGDLVEARRLLREMEADFAAHAKSKGGGGGGGGPAGAGGGKRSGRASESSEDDWTANVRTANTFVRGCLVGGGVDDALHLLRRLGADGERGHGCWAAVEPDGSTLEHCGVLCAQALRLDDAAEMAERARDGGAVHAAARVHVAICRGAALMGLWKRCLGEAKRARKLLKSSDGAEPSAEAGEGADGRATFRAHQRAEALADVAALERLAQATPPPGASMPLLLRRTLPLPAARAEAERRAGDSVDGVASLVQAELGASFGLTQWQATLNQRVAGRGDARASAVRRGLVRVLGGGGGQRAAGGGAKKEAAKVLAAGSNVAGPLDLHALFGSGDDAEGRPTASAASAGEREEREPTSAAPPPARTFRLEIGCGAGEWVAEQAAATAEEGSARVGWLALELRRDRAHATAARLALAGRRDVATVACDATHFLADWIAPRQLEAIYANHPAPPQQAPSSTSEPSDGEAAAAPEAEHMLDSRLLDAAARALLPGQGTLTIVTDNEWYGGLLLDALSAHGAFHAAPSARGVPDSRVVRAIGRMQLLSAAPGPWCRHAPVKASSYFDRLWQSGISAHSAAHERFVLHVARKAAVATAQ